MTPDEGERLRKVEREMAAATERMNGFAAAIGEGKASTERREQEHRVVQEEFRRSLTELRVANERHATKVAFIVGVLTVLGQAALTFLLRK